MDINYIFKFSDTFNNINNKIYAYLDYIWEDTNITSLSTKYNLSKGIVVSEEEKITTYNDKLKYYSYGGE